jgi:copper resistance protein B
MRRRGSRTALAALATLLACAAVATAQSMPPADHATHGDASQQTGAAPQQTPDSQPPVPGGHAGHQQSGEQQQAYPQGLPPITDEDRAAAFPQIERRHTVHDHGVHSFVLFDQLEWRTGSGANAGSWDTQGWVGGDVNRVWFRTEGEAASGDAADAQVHALFGRAIAPWWDLVAGLRQDVGPGPDRTWAAIGIQGLAPYWFEVQATAYVGASGRTHLRLESEYELLVTNRLVLQPVAEVEIYGKSDPERGIGAGLSTLDTGLRLRYEIRRELAPYVGVTWTGRFFGTADLARAAGKETSGARLALGVRAWF